MNPVLFAIILIRVLSVYLLAQGLVHFGQNATMTFFAGNDGPEATRFYWLNAGFFILMPLLMGLLLWLLAPRISCAIVGQGAQVDTTTPLSIEGIVGAVISVAGLIVLVIYLPILVSSAIHIYDVPFATGLTWSKAFLNGNGLVVVFGVALFVGARGWVRLIAFLRAWSGETESRN